MRCDAMRCDVMCCDDGDGDYDDDDEKTSEHVQTTTHYIHTFSGVDKLPIARRKPARMLFPFEICESQAKFYRDGGMREAP